MGIHTFIDARNHYWQFHSDVIEPVEKKPIRAANTVTETQNSTAKDSTSNTEKNDEIANKAKSETVHEICSVQKPKDSSNKAPEKETVKELTPVLGYRSKFNLENNNEPVKVINDEHMQENMY